MRRNGATSEKHSRWRDRLSLRLYLAVPLCFGLFACDAARAPNTALGFGGYASIARSSLPDARERSAGGFAVTATQAHVTHTGINHYWDIRGGIGGGGGGVAGHLEMHGEVGKALGLHGDDEHGFTLRGGFGGLVQGQADAAVYRVQLPTAFAGWVYHARSPEAPFHIELGVRSSLNLYARERDSVATYDHGISADVGLGFLAMGEGFAVQADYARTFDGTPVHTVHARGCVAFFGMVCLDGRYDRIDVGNGDHVGVSMIQLYFMMGAINGAEPEEIPSNGASPMTDDSMNGAPDASGQNGGDAPSTSDGPPTETPQ